MRHVQKNVKRAAAKQPRAYLPNPPLAQAPRTELPGRSTPGLQRIYNSLVQLSQIELYANVGAQVSEQGTTHHLCLLVSMRPSALATLELLDFQRGIL